MGMLLYFMFDRFCADPVPEKDYLNEVPVLIQIREMNERYTVS